LRKRVNASRWADVPAEIRKWNRGGGRVLRGLVLRREAEATLIWGDVMDFHIITPRGEAHILSTDEAGRIVTPLPAPLAVPAPEHEAGTKIS
jgi:hypothetical protein